MMAHNPEPPAWTALLLRDDRKERRPIKANLANTRIALRECPELKGIVAYDCFAHKVVRVAPTPWREDLGPWESIDDLRLTEFLQLNELNATVEVVSQGVLIEAHERSYHPVRQYLEGISWDGTSRAESWLTTYLGVADSAYVRAVARKFLIAAVARVFEPGCKMDTMLVLEGAQGIGKSTALQILAGEDWFADQIPNLSSKDALIQLQGKWLIEVSELDAMRKAEITETKAFLSTTADRYRAPYARSAQDYARQCVFAGTTNSDDYLRDATGGRRFWPVHCTRIDREGLARDRDQLWAEAVVLFRAGEQWHLTVSEERLAAAEQGGRFAEDPWAASIDSYVWTRRRVTLEEVLRASELELKPNQIDRLHRMRVSDHLVRWGWKPGKSGSQRYYLRPAQIPEEKAEYVAKVREAHEFDALAFSSVVLVPEQQRLS